ncbi:DNA repair protein RadA [Candidatus Babela massiliensis]|uniref:DNA repair protein RadA n=1 Tax=Candidatus Babela massiliensis TaxID=673862 RepID=V6DIH5_9BACT|nr:DNA repair protein RadA [Candidatus Babela massiliensis]CDK30728.1 DNA repair protein RadA [Candidatus Babela massiliensis]
MSKKVILYICKNCAYQTVKWLGCCPECKQWNTLELKDQGKFTEPNSLRLYNLLDIESKSMERMTSGVKEWDRVTGSGLVRASFVVLTGDPGIGKSTLLIQIAYKLSERYKTYYFSSEESLEQVKLRSQRLNCISSNLLFSDEADLDNIINFSKDNKPDLIIIDSIQNCFLKETNNTPGSINMLKESAFKLMRLAKENDITVIISGHITKEGIIAGPKMLEHMVDAVFYLQAEDCWQTRILRSVKNRFGTVNEIGFFQMGSNGLEEVSNINQQLLQDTSNNPGSVLISFIEGSRPLLIELQALVLSTKYGIAQRVVSGIDQTQIVLIAAILEKYLQIKFSSQDIFFKISGGFKIKGSACDLGIALALLSSYFQKPLPEKILALGEISLTGQIKPINFINLYASESEKFGINTLLISSNQKIETNAKTIRFVSVYELLSLFD